MAENQQNFIDRIWKDKEGKQALAQLPNIPLVLWLVFTILANKSDGNIKTVSELLAFGFLFTWAWLEITSGASYFRRILGAAVLVILVANKLA